VDTGPVRSSGDDPEDPQVADDPDQRRKLPRRSRHQTRDLLLLAGSLLADRTVTRRDDDLLSAWLASVRFDDVLSVAKRLQLYLDDIAGEDLDDLGPSARRRFVRDHRDEILALDAHTYRDITKSIAYTVFENERDFREQLARDLLSVDRVNDHEGLTAAYGSLVEEYGGTPPVERMIATLADVEFRRVRHLASVYVEMGAAPYAGHPLLRELLAAVVEEACDLDSPTSLASLYRELLGHHGWELRGGLDFRHLVVALYSLVQGHLFIDRVYPAGIDIEVPWAAPDGSEGTRSAFSLAVEGIVRQFAEPAAGSDTARPGDDGAGVEVRDVAVRDVEVAHDEAIDARR
jgi:hypothetical protein